MFNPYQKIPTIFTRNTVSKVLSKSYINPIVEYLKDLIWGWTEKIDGTNVGINWDGHKVSFQGRTEDAEFTPKQLDFLNEMFAGEDMAQIFEQKFGEKETTIYGELYGNDIQKVGRDYREDYGFRVFDVKINGFYLSRQNVEDVATYFGLEIVPIVGQGTLQEAILYVLCHQKSTVDGCRAPLEGVVARPLVDIYNNKGERILVKIKRQDFKAVNLKNTVKYCCSENGQFVTVNLQENFFEYSYYAILEDKEFDTYGFYSVEKVDGHLTTNVKRLGVFCSTK